MPTPTPEDAAQADEIRMHTEKWVPGDSRIRIIVAQALADARAAALAEAAKCADSVGASYRRQAGDARTRGYSPGAHTNWRGIELAESRADAAELVAANIRALAAPAPEPKEDR